MLESSEEELDELERGTTVENMDMLDTNVMELVVVDTEDEVELFEVSTRVALVNTDEKAMLSLDDVELLLAGRTDEETTLHFPNPAWHDCGLQ